MGIGYVFTILYCANHKICTPLFDKPCTPHQEEKVKFQPCSYALADPGGILAIPAMAPQKPERGPTIFCPPKTIKENIINVVLLA